jgi:hypothetical protein
MTHCSSATPFRWTARAVLSVACLSAACSHSEPFSDSQSTSTPFDPSPPVRLTLNPAHDGNPAWLADGSGILYSARQAHRPDADVCLAELPATGGSQRQLECDVPGTAKSTDAAQSPAVGPDGRLALLSAGNGSIGGESPVFLGIAIAPGLDASEAQTVRSLPFTPAGGVPQDYAGHLRWSTPERLIYVGQRFRTARSCPEDCPLDTLIVGTEVTLLDISGGTAVGTAVAGTTEATSVTPIEDGAAILFTLPADSRVYRRALASADVAVVHDFGSGGIARDVHASGSRVAVIVGGRVAYGLHRFGIEVQSDSGGILHLLELGGDDLVLDTPGRLYRRPAVSPDGSRVVAEGFPLVIVGPPAAPDTTVNLNGDLYVFGGES